MPAVPFKLNQDRRHHIPRQRHKVTNWPAYEASLRQRGSLTIWFTDEAVAAWQAEPRTTRGGQPWYSPLAILTALTLRAVFHLAYRQAEGLIGSIIGLLGLALRHDRRRDVPCFSISHSPAPLSFSPALSTSKCSGPVPARRSGGTSSVFARRLSVEWSGTARSSPSSPMTEPISPSVCLSARPKTMPIVSAVVIARAE